MLICRSPTKGSSLNDRHLSSTCNTFTYLFIFAYLLYPFWANIYLFKHIVRVYVYKRTFNYTHAHIHTHVCADMCLRTPEIGVYV